jgi:hypothetical protein
LRSARVSSRDAVRASMSRFAASASPLAGGRADGRSTASVSAGGVAETGASGTGAPASRGAVDIATLATRGTLPSRDTDHSVTAIRSPAAAAIHTNTRRWGNGITTPRSASAAPGSRDAGTAPVDTSGISTATSRRHATQPARCASSTATSSARSPPST